MPRRRPRPDGDGRLWGDGFEVETLIHVRVAKAGLVVAEVPSFEHPRIHGVSNLNAFRDGRRVLQTIVAERRHPGGAPAQLAIGPWSNRWPGWPMTAPFRLGQLQTGAPNDRGSYAGQVRRPVATRTADESGFW